MGLTMKLSKLFITGCDSKTSWMLPWFKENFFKHNPDSELKVYNFDNIDGIKWFVKPSVMHKASKLAEKVVWLDTDVEVRSNLDSIFDYIEPNKLSMVKDHPWTIRRQEVWHNSGVVGFSGTPTILTHWASECSRITEEQGPMFGDQDILHYLVREGMNRLVHINDLPHSYNVLRLDLIDNATPKNIKCMHWTGKKGKEKIKELISG